MPPIELHTLLELVGALDDSDVPGSASDRFRHYLQENVQQVGDVRAYVEDALARPGDQFNKALQDLINHTGQLLGFDVQYGRYRGARGQIGFDGLWHSPTEWALVVEAKTTDVYVVKTATLLGYVNALVSEGQIKNPAQALGLYVYGRFDAGTGQLENAIVVEGRRQQLRVISVEALLNLLELKQEYDLEHQAILNLLLPAPVRVDPLVNLIFDVVSQEKREAVEAQITTSAQIEAEPPVLKEGPAGACYLLPAADSEDGTPVMENLRRWLNRGLWGLGQRTGYRRSFVAGDRLCFYAARTGVVAECVAASSSFELDRKENPSKVEVRYAIRLKDVRWLREPVELAAEVRAQLSAFQGRDPNKGWAWFVQGTSQLTENDFNVLTGRVSTPQCQTALSGRRGAPSSLASIAENYTGKTVRAIAFQGERHEVPSWKDAMLVLFECLRSQGQQRFEEAALTIQGRKRPYIARDPDELRMPQQIPCTYLYVETNLGANQVAKLCHTLLARMDYPGTALAFETT